MLKRLLIVLTCIAGIVFVPYWVGSKMDPRHIDVIVSWWTGFVPLFISILLIKFAIIPAINWIIKGS
jgi:hypothetical protein